MGSKRVVINIGDKFKKLTIISEGKDKYHWVCECICGSIIEDMACNIRKRTACGNCPKSWLKGLVFGKLTVTGLGEKKVGDKNPTMWECLCECGKTKTATSAGLTRGITTHCGCSTPARIPKDITGVTKGRLTALRSTNTKSNNGDYIWEFSCTCGNYTTTTIGNFNFGHTTSCGCAKKDCHLTKSNYHGQQGTPTYNSWRKMRERCNNPRDVLYPRYGGKGISVCRRWDSSFRYFLEDMGSSPDGFTIDRIDGKGNYEPDNCRWASNSVQSRNRVSHLGTSIYKGVQFEKSSSKWVATITVGSILCKKIGRYPTEELAAKAYNLASELIFGEGCSFLNLNEVDNDYSGIHRKGKFFTHWVPLMIEEKNKRYEEDKQQ